YRIIIANALLGGSEYRSCRRLALARLAPKFACRHLRLTGAELHHHAGASQVLVIGPGIPLTARELGFGLDTLTLFFLHGFVRVTFGLNRRGLLGIDPLAPLRIRPAEYRQPVLVQ